MTYFECEYCLKKFVSEGFFKRHQCEEMKRYKLLRSNRGIAAYNLFVKWMRKKVTRTPSEDEFVNSRHFKPFFRFVEFSKKVALPGQDKFISYMIDKGVLPKDWDSKVVYKHYMDHFDVLFTPEEQASISVETVFELSRIFDCETNQIFLHLEPNTLIQIIQAKKFSPWFLLFSKKFLWFIQNEMTREQKLIMQHYIDPDHWHNVFKKYPEKVKKMQSYVDALEL